jgi:predicted ferric reductase
LARLSPAAAARVLTTGVAAVGGGVVAFWWLHLPHGFASLVDATSAVGQLSGLLAGYSLIVLIAVMGRIPLLEATVGSDRLTRGHAVAGRYTVSLLVLHGCTVAWAYALGGRVSVPREALLLLRDYPDVSWAAVGGGILLGVGLVSIRAARRRLSYEVWYHLHLLTYLALALAFSHQFAVGRDFVHDRAARVAWSALYVTVLAAVVHYRLVRPVVRSLRTSLRVADVVTEPSGCTSIRLQGRDIADLGARSGQFFRLRFMAEGLWWQCHPFSLSAPPSADGLRFTIMPVGDHTRALARLRTGTRVLAEGPYGTLTAARRRHAKVLLIAGGIGITPLRALFESIEAGPGQLSLIYRCRSETEATFRSELEELARARGASVVYVTGRTADLERPLDADHLRSLVPDLAERDVFLCAPEQLMADVTRSLRDVGLPRADIHSESFELLAGSGIPRWQTVGVSVVLLCVLGVVGVRAELLGRATGPWLAAPSAPIVAAGPPTGADANGDVTILGPIERTLFSSVQVAAVLRHGRLFDVRALMLPNHDAHSRQLSAMAEPILRQEALRAGNARINAVTGASYTSQAYAQSLQGALDRAPH